MVAHRLQIWLDEHGLAEIGPNLAEQGIDRLEDVWGLEKDDLTEPLMDMGIEMYDDLLEFSQA